MISAGSQVRILPRPPSEEGKAEARQGEESHEANNDRFEFRQQKKFQSPNQPQAFRLGWFFDIYIQVSKYNF